MEKELSFDELLNKIKTYISDENQLNVIINAYDYAKFCHGDRLRKNKESYISHPINVAMILTTLNVDYITLAASLLHETINHGNSSKEIIEEKFGSEIANIVYSISRINRLSLNDDKESSAINLRKVLVGLCEDVRVLYIKLADRLHNMRTIWALEEDEIKSKIYETQNVLIPIAARLGINSIKSELENLCLKYSKPDVYHDIEEKLNNSKNELNATLEEMKNDLSEILSEHGIKFKIKGRVKSIHSIYEKMQNGHKWNEIYDILALRIIVEEISECYLAIGLIHAKYRPLPNRFKDYIAMPKGNMYQSLHTSIVGLDGYVFEVQVRTYEMDEVAEKGIASHWSYKEHSDGSVTNIMEEKLELFRNLIEQNVDNSSELDFENTVNTEFFGKMIYCVTPKGDVIELPLHSTPIDFAYRIHSHVGETTASAIVNNKIVPLDSELMDGDVVTIKTSSTAKPSREWLNFVKTSQAKNKIKAYFSKQDKEKYTLIGKDLLEKEIRKRKLSITEVLSSDHIDKLVKNLKLNDLDEIYLSIGSLRYTPTFIINSIFEDKKDVTDILIEKVNKNNKIDKHDYKSDIIVSGADNILISLANCCNPIKGDEIIGYITRGQGITIHKKDCPNIKDDCQRLIDVAWNEKSDNSYSCYLIITSENDKNVLVNIISLCSSKNISVDGIKTSQGLLETKYRLSIKIGSTSDLQNLINALKNLKNVKNVERYID